ncbi:MAG TPA: PDZ domain-containing protein, partial [Desulfomonilaceae bacterium]|nr:PDZ domain-containing protein [Desulfomonilaceae bacterium]
FGLGHTVTQGIISATGRVIGSGPYDDFLQTDAPINPGNSGGPLVNIKGEVIGINSAIMPGGQGLGFAIPSNMAKSVTTQLREKGRVVRGWIGVSIQTVTREMAKSFGLKEPIGALIAEVAAGGPADRGGIRQGDIIVSYDGKDVKSAKDLPRMVAETPVGKEVNVTVFRNGKEVPLRAKVEELTKERVAVLSHEPAQSFGMKVDNLSAKWRQQFSIRDKSGVVVVSIDQGSMAEESGIQPGDIIKQVNHKPVKNIQEFNVAMAKVEKGQPVLYLLQRGEKSFFVTMESGQ